MASVPINVSQDVWTTWYTSTAITTTTNSYSTANGSWDAPWIAWNNANVTGGTITVGWIPPAPTRAEELRRQQLERRQFSQEEMEERNRLHRERVLAEAARMDEAHANALELLRMILPAEDLEEFETTGLLYCTGSLGTRFQIDSGYSGNVVVLDDEGNRQGAFCAHPNMYDQEGRRLPDADAWISQILALRDDEAEFMSLANCHWGVRPYPRDRAHRPLTQVIAA